jgi:hypothetical protein
MKKLLALAIVITISGSVHSQLMSKRRLATENEVFTMEVTYGEDFLTEVLWFISDPIELIREIEVTKDLDMKKLMESGKVKMSGGKVYEQAKFTNSASGLFESKNDSSITIRFEQGEGRYLTFVKQEPTAQDVRYYKLHKVAGADEKGNYVAYAGDVWKLLAGGYVKLEFKAKGNMKAKTQKTRIRGLKKDGSEKKGVIGVIKKN